MSCRILESESILSLAIGAASFRRSFESLRLGTYSFTGHALDTAEGIVLLATEFYDLNTTAFNNRYPGTNGEDTRYPEDVIPFEVPEDFGILSVPRDPFPQDKLVALYKTAQCLLYQCDDGELTDHPIFKQLTHFLSAVAHEIISALPAYESAPWG